MGDYKRLKYLLIFFLGFYFIAGLSTEIFLPNRQKDFIPFFSWFLFIYVPSENRENYSLLISSVDEELFDTPILFEEAGNLVHEAKSPKAREIIRNMVLASLNGRREELASLRKQFEDIYLPRPTQYELAVITYNPLTRYKNGEYKIKMHLGKFRTD